MAKETLTTKNTGDQVVLQNMKYLITAQIHLHSLNKIDLFDMFYSAS